MHEDGWWQQLSLPWFCHRGVQSEGRLGRYDWKLVVSVEIDQVCHTVETPVPRPHHTLGVDQQQVLPPAALHPGQHILAGAALALPHQEVAVLH